MSTNSSEKGEKKEVSSPKAVDGLPADSIVTPDSDEWNIRYAAYTAAGARGLAKSFRYLAFTSDFGEALRPVISARIVTGAYAIAFGYCFVDVAWEAYKLDRRGYITEHNKPMTLTQCIVERSTFQAIASLALPTLIIHTSVDMAKHATKRIGRFGKWGPSIVGLSMIPLLPLYLDEPVEKAIEWGFEHYGPWAEKNHKD